MKESSFKDVVIHGKELPGALITALINVYIKDNASVDAISNHLRDICPLLYSSDDSVCSKVRKVQILILMIKGTRREKYYRKFSFWLKMLH